MCSLIPTARIPAVHRIVALGDIHGDWAALQSALRVAKVCDRDGRWTGGNTHVVQVGDLLDRADRTGAGTDEQSESRIIRYLLALKAQAKRYNGDVHLLLGNHELMNVYGDFRYVSPLGLKDFQGRRAEQFKPGGNMARTLACNTNMVLQIGSWLFSHAGVTIDVTERWTLEQINQQVRDYLLGHGREPSSQVIDTLWHRQYSHPRACSAIDRTLKAWKARNMAIGHTVQDRGINSMCNGSLWKVDVGMSNAFGRRAVEVLEILDDGAQVNVLKGKVSI